MDFGTVAPAVGQGLLIFAGLWLAYETRSLRNVSAQQINESVLAERNREKPYLHLQVEIQGESVEAIRVKNVSANLAVNLVMFCYDRRNHNFLKVSSVLSFVTGEEEDRRAFSTKRYDLAGLTAEVGRQLCQLDMNDFREKVNHVIQSETDRFIIGVIVHDHLGNPYIWFRAFLFGENDAPRYKASRFTNSGEALKKIKANKTYA